MLGRTYEMENGIYKPTSRIVRGNEVVDCMFASATASQLNGEYRILGGVKPKNIPEDIDVTAFSQNARTFAIFHLYAVPISSRKTVLDLELRARAGVQPGEHIVVCSGSGRNRILAISELSVEKVR